METVSGFKRFIVCIFSQSKPRGLNLFKIYFFSLSFNNNNYKINKNNSEIILLTGV